MHMNLLITGNPIKLTVTKFNDFSGTNYLQVPVL